MIFYVKGKAVGVTGGGGVKGTAAPRPPSPVSPAKFVF